MGSMRPLVVLVAVMLGGCQLPEKPVHQVERTRIYQQDEDAVWSKVLRFLQANQIEVQSSDRATGVIKAARSNYQDQGWAECERVWVTSTSSNTGRPTKARPVDRDLVLAVQLSEAAGATTVTVDAEFTEQLINPHRNLPFRQRCGSTGTIEMALLDAIGPAPSTSPPPAPPSESG